MPLLQIFSILQGITYPGDSMNNLEESKTYLFTLTADGQEHTGIRSGLNSRIFRSVDIGSLQNDPGWIFDSQGRMEPWKLEGITEEEGKMVFYGPRIRGEEFSLSNLTLEKLERIVSLFRSIRDKQISYQGFFSRGWVFLEDGRILLLPGNLMEFIRKSDNEESRIKFWYPYNHPDTTGREGLEFTTAILTVLLLKGEHPYSPLETEEDNRNEQLRREPPLSPELMIPGLQKELADLLTLSFKGGQDSLKQWDKAIRNWKEEGAVSHLSDDERRVLSQKADQQQERSDKKQKFRQTWRRKNTIYAISAAIILFLGMIVSAPIKKALEPPMTMGMTPREVVEAYYNCFNTLDQDMMDDAIDKKVGKRDISEVTNFFVTSRVRMGYEGKSGAITAQDWVDSGRPSLKYGETLYGVANVSIHDLGSEQFRINYEKWVPGSAEEADMESNKPIPPQGYNITDMISLEKQKRGNWLIVSLDRSISDFAQ